MALESGSVPKRNARSAPSLGFSLVDAYIVRVEVERAAPRALVLVDVTFRPELNFTVYPPTLGVHAPAGFRFPQHCAADEAIACAPLFGSGGRSASLTPDHVQGFLLSEDFFAAGFPLREDGSVALQLKVSISVELPFSSRPA